MRKILFEIEVENVGAARRIESLREEIRRLNKEIKGAEVGSPVYNDLIAKLTDAKQETARLKDEQKALNREFQAARFPKDSLAGLRIEYAKLTEQIKVLSAAERGSPFGQSIIANAANVKRQIDGIEQSIGRFTGNVGNYRSAFQGLNNVLLQLGAGFGVNEIIQQNTRLSDSIANVAKTTGLTIDEAERLAETLKFRDTRTSLADQLQIAEIGGQLGIANTQIEDFTAGVDVLNVALGDQFGNVEVLTREFAGLRNVLTDFKTDDAAQDILKLGNAVNFLEAEGNATGQSIVDFASRIAGAGVPLGATTEQIVGLSTTLSELSINPERGATAVSRLLTELARAPELFAQAIGEPTAKFRKLVQTDIVGALSLVSERVATSSESNVAFAQTLDELGIGSQGAIEVFGKLGGSTDLLTKRIAQAGETLKNTDSITREFEVKNTNAAAAVEKLRNALIGAFTGEDAQEAIAAIANELTIFVGILAEIPGFVAENEEEVLALAAAFIYLNRQGLVSAIPLLGTLTQNFGLLTTAAGRATIATELNAVATRALAAAQAALPFIAVIAGVYAIVKAYEAYEESASASEKAARSLAAAQGDIAKESAKEAEAVRKNIEVLKFEIDNKEARKAAIESLVSAYPAYLKGIDLEKASIQELDRIQNQLTESIIRSVAERRKASAQDEVAERIIEQTLKIQELERRTPAQVSTQDVGQFVGASAVAQQATDQAAQRNIQQLNAARSELRKLQDELEKTGAAFDDAFNIGGGDRQLSQQQKDLLQFNADLSAQFPGLAGETSKATEETKRLGNESATTGDKIKGLGGSSKGAKDDINAQAGSVAFLKDAISKLQKQIDSTSPGSPALANLIKQLDEAKKRLKDAERGLLGKTFESLFGKELTAPELDTGDADRPELGIVSELTVKESPDAKERAAAIKEEIERDLGAIEFPIEPTVSPETLAAQAAFDKQREEGNEKDRKRKEENAEAEKQRALEVKEALVNAGIDTAQAIADGVFQIQQQRLEQERDLVIENLDAEYKKKIDAAQGNAVKITALEKEREQKRAAIEKAAAEERKKIALKEASINIALSILKALTGSPPPFNFIAAGVVAAAGAIQLATINAQQFADSGVAKRVREQTKKRLGNAIAISKLPPGIIRERPNVAPTAKGDNVLALVKPGEMILNEQHQRAVKQRAGDDIFGLVGVPGESMHRRSRNIPSFAEGGVVGIVPQAGFRDTLNQQNAAIVVQTESRFTYEQIRQMAEIQAGILAQAVGGSVYAATTAAGDENNRLRERQQIAQQNRIG